jgi:cell division protein ZapD
MHATSISLEIAPDTEVAQNSRMAEASPYQTDVGVDRRHIAFEQPLNERMRTFLRIESLYRQATRHARDDAAHSARAPIGNLLEMLAITSRGDVRADSLKELDRHTLRLGQYQRSPGVDGDRLARLMRDVDDIRSTLSAAGKHFLAPLRDNDFLNAVRHRSAIPGGTCKFDLPDYGYWLELPGAERNRQIRSWLEQLKPLCDAIDQILWLTREGSTPAQQVARSGLYHHNLGKEDHFGMVRVLIPINAGIYPEISAGHHRFTVRFSEWQGTEQRARQANGDVEFMLALC